MDLTAFYHDYTDLQTTEPLEPSVVGDPPQYILLPNVLTNGKDARGRGATLRCGCPRRRSSSSMTN